MEGGEENRTNEMNVGICYERVQMDSADEWSERGTRRGEGFQDVSINLT